MFKHQYLKILEWRKALRETLKAPLLEIAPVRVHGRVSGPVVTAEAVVVCEVYNSGTTIACTE